jgi:7,8-dihydropterin-6-yl-methyl-4-(beta-D-ribofuranosyl)aminobenzene 5'-phosphate synthase
MKIYILVEDTAKEGFEPEHGLSVYFEKDNNKFIFDLGQSNKFLKNALRLGINLNEADYLIFSHGHYDHTGGLKYFKVSNKIKIIAHPHCLYPKYDGNRYIGFPKYKNDWIILLKEEKTKLSKNVYFLGQIPGQRRSHLGEYVKDGIRCKDFLLDDSALAITEKDKLIIIAGCAHSGIVNIVNYARKVFKAKEIIVIGGFHMLEYSDKEIDDTIRELKNLNVVRIFPGHCTGKKAIKKMLDSINGEKLFAGKIIEV